MIMRKIRDIIESPFPVPTNSLWLNGANLKGFINGKWVTLGGVKKAAAVADLAGTEDASAICTKVNELLSSLRSAGVLGV